jgi:hypothetical protein
MYYADRHTAWEQMLGTDVLHCIAGHLLASDGVPSLGRLARASTACYLLLQPVLRSEKRPHLRKRECARLMQALRIGPCWFQAPEALWRRSAYISGRGRLIISERSNGYCNLTIITPSAAPHSGTIMHFLIMPLLATTHVLHHYTSLDHLQRYLERHTVLSALPEAGSSQASAAPPPHGT